MKNKLKNINGLKDEMDDWIKKAPKYLVDCMADYELDEFFEKYMVKLYREYVKTDEFRKVAFSAMGRFTRLAFDPENFSFDGAFQDKIIETMENEMLRRIESVCVKEKQNEKDKCPDKCP